MKIQFFLFIVLALLNLTASSQTQFIVKGKIEFEKKTNYYKQLDNEDESFREMLKNALPQEKTSYFDLLFSDNKTLYKPGREVISAKKAPEWFDGPATDNVVFTDLEKENITSQKTVFDNVFNVEDSVRKMDWKITPDTRTIAGIECRKATAIIMDTVFVIAFYTDQIITPGGPESFNGLPGMILGLVVPRLYSTWFATKVELTNITETMLLPPKKGKKTTSTNLKTQLKASMKDWGKMGAKNMLQVSI